MPKRVLFVIDGLAGGGAEKVVLTLAGEMVRRGHEVAIANLRDERVYAIPGDVSLLPCYDTRSRKLRKIGEIARRARLLDRALAGRPAWDLVVSTLFMSDRIVRSSNLAESAWYGVPNTPSAAQLGHVTGMKRMRRIARLRRTYDGRKVVAVSHGVARDLVDVVGARPSHLEVIHNPFNVEEVRRLAVESCPFEGKDYLVSVGRFTREKRHDRLLGAFARSEYEGRLVLVGTGTGEQIRQVAGRVRELGLSGRVDLIGFHENPYPFMKHARALVLGSDTEGFGNVLVEALICGTPVVSTHCPHGPDEILTGALSVGLADLTEESLAAAIDRVLASPPRISEDHYLPFSVQSITDRYLSLAD